MATIEVSDELHAAAAYFGAVGERWLDELPALVASLEADWGISAGRTLTGGQFAYVAQAVTAEGEPAVLKVAVPRGPSEFAQELRTLQLAQGDPYARLLRFDEERRSLLLERLGRQMAELGWSVDRQLAAITETVARGWQPVNVDRLADGATRARRLADDIPRAWERVGRPCSEWSIERAVELRRRASAMVGSPRAGARSRRRPPLERPRSARRRCHTRRRGAVPADRSPGSGVGTGPRPRRHPPRLERRAPRGRRRHGSCRVRSLRIRLPPHGR